VTPSRSCVWRDAVKDPPNHERRVWTDQGELSYTDDHDDNTPSRRYQSLWVRGSGTPVLIQPRVWCDPIPPTEDGLTVEDVRRAVDALHYAGGDEAYPMVVDPEACLASAARLRAALPAEGGDE
jgi:hypothetical protein